MLRINCFTAFLILAATACRPPVTVPETIAVAAGCTSAPAPPSGAPSDWTATVHPNCYDDLERLGRWIGSKGALPPKVTPEPLFLPVSAGSVGKSSSDVVVLVHGWAPGYRDALDANNDKLLWWDTRATNSEGVYSSDWAWVQTAVDTSSVSECVSSTGFFQQLATHHPDADVLGFSWIDHSATDGSFLDLIQVYRSEAYTNISGIRLANALESALSPDFWQKSGHRLHLIGHSHGSKVATVAALTLQERGKLVDHLTILDSPESEVTLEGNGANLLGFYLEKMKIADPVSGVGGTFVDNNASFFGVTYAGLPNIVNINLDPGALYSLSEAGDKHSYSAAWYAGAAATVDALKLSIPLALDWPPLPSVFQPPVSQGQTLNQSFQPSSQISDPCSQLTRLFPGQWALSPGSPQLGPFGYSTEPVPIEGGSHANVSCQPECSAPTSLTLGGPNSDPGSKTAFFNGGYPNPVFTDGYGLAFDVTFTNASNGDYLVATVDSPEEGEGGIQEVILVMDGRSQPDGTYPVAFNADISGTLLDVGFAFYLVPASGSKVEVTVENFRRVVVSGV